MGKIIKLKLWSCFFSFVMKKHVIISIFLHLTFRIICQKRVVFLPAMTVCLKLETLRSVALHHQEQSVIPFYFDRNLFYIHSAKIWMLPHLLHMRSTRTYCPRKQSKPTQWKKGELALKIVELTLTVYLQAL